MRCNDCHGLGRLASTYIPCPTCGGHGQTYCCEGATDNPCLEVDEDYEHLYRDVGGSE